MIRSAGHVVLAFFSAVTVGAGAVGLGFAGFVMIGTLMSSPDETVLVAWAGMGLLAFLVAWPVFLIGMALIGGPVWWLLHRLRRTSRRAAMIAGAVGAPLVGLVLAADADLGLLAAIGIGLIVPGGLAGLTGHAVAYQRRVTPPPAPPV